MSASVGSFSEESSARTVQIPCGTVHYHEAGPTDGHPVVLLHGSGPGATGWSNFKTNIVALAERFRVFAPDQLGWGKSSAVTFDERDHIQMLVELLDAWGVPRAALVGNSMGGANATTFAAQHPDRVSHLITMGSGSSGVNLLSAADGPSEGVKVLRQAYLDPSVEQMRQLVEVMSYGTQFAAEELILERARSAQANQTHLDNFIAGMHRGRRSVASPEHVSRIAAPSLIIHGRDDRVVPLEGSLRLSSLIDDSRLVIFNRCGHWAQAEHAVEFNRLVLGFINNN